MDNLGKSWRFYTSKREHIKSGDMYRMWRNFLDVMPSRFMKILTVAVMIFVVATTSRETTIKVADGISAMGGVPACEIKLK